MEHGLGNGQIMHTETNCDMPKLVYTNRTLSEEIGNRIVRQLETKCGVPQTVCLSPTFFTFYLDFTLSGVNGKLKIRESNIIFFQSFTLPLSVNFADVG